MQNAASTASLQQGLKYHRDGDLVRACQCYNASLQANPRNSDALHLLGLATAALGDAPQGISFIQQALKIQPNFPAAWYNLANLLQKNQLWEEAETAYRKALLGQPKSGDILCNLGNVLLLLKKYDQAIESFKKALKIDPKNASVHHNLGLGYSRLGKFHEAIDSFAKAIALQPDFSNALEDLGAAQEKLSLLDKAIDSYRKALQLQPGNSAIWCNLGGCLIKQDRIEEASAAFKRALVVNPSHAPSLCNLGNLYRKKNQLQEALETYQRAASLDPFAVEPLSNAGCIYLELGQFSNAEDNFRKVLLTRPDYTLAAWNLAVTLLTAGDFEQGWPAYEMRWANDYMAKVRRVFPMPLWLGDAPIEGKSILIHAEQGYGDTLHFVRYVPLLAARGAKVYLQVQPALKSLLAQLPGAVAVTDQSDIPDGLDFHCPLLSLPLAFATRLETIPSDVPYVKANPERVQLWRDKIRALPARKIGITWAGNPKHENDHNRSIPLALFSSIVFPDTVGVLNLQKQISDADRGQLSASSRIIDLSADFADFSDTAALVDQLDLVITVDTATAHLAGAMGKKVWLLIPYAAEWRWLYQRSDSPWYPGMRLFRQPALGDWASVLTEVSRELGNVFS